MKKGSWIPIIILLLVFSVGCAGTPVRDAVKVDLSLPVGKIEGNQFTGIRFPFKISAPPNWQVTTKYPKFLLDLGFEKEGLEESQVFIFNPATQSNLQIDFTPAGRYSRFDQAKIEWLTTIAGSSFKYEFQKDYGKNVLFEISSTEVYSLKGVPFAAKKYTTYTIKGLKREHGWVYAFAEPYQIFIIYMVVEKEGVEDRQAIKEILDSFEVIAKQ
ncbi:MAG: hypothetical protein HY882_08015 [Deltaproteobacteria bacterium]|nr:hypothetical protein [Deltaproteobacteria bacterium]